MNFIFGGYLYLMVYILYFVCVGNIVRDGSCK